MLQGADSGNPDLVTAHISANNYKEHRPPSKEREHLKVVRAFQDGQYVFTHGKGLMRGQNVFFEIFRFEDGLIVEHWAFSAIGAPPNQSGHTQTDGPTEANLTADTEKSKAIVREYYETIHISGDHSKIPEYFSGDRCIRHEPGVRDGVAAFKRDLAELTTNRSIDEIKFLFGQGDFVFIAAKGSHASRPCIYIDHTGLKKGRSLSAGDSPKRSTSGALEKQEWHSIVRTN